MIVVYQVALSAVRTMCNTAPPMSAQPSPDRDVDEFVRGVSSRRVADGQPALITDSGVYRVLDGIMVGRETTVDSDPKVQADRRRRAVKRSRDRVPYQ